MGLKQQIDELLDAERTHEREQLIQEALDAHVDLLRAKKAYDAACARLVPIKHELLQVAA